jgi:hypothetical protein
MDSTAIIFSISAAILSGMGTAIISGIRESKREKTRQAEREHDHLKLELKDLKIQLYQVERDLTIWKDKYYNAIQELIGVKAELEDTLIKISLLSLDITELE